MVCSREGCENTFDPPRRKFCSKSCSIKHHDSLRQGTPARLASRLAHYHRKDWYAQYRRRLRRRIRQRTEEV
jgi:hypothetical protein